MLMWVSTERVPPSFFLAPALIVHPLLLRLELQGRQDDDDGEQDSGSRGGQPEVLEPGAVVVDELDDRLG